MMVKQKIHIRVGKKHRGGFKMDASQKEIKQPLWSSSDYNSQTALPTARFAIEVNIPDAKFELEGEVVAKINFKLEKKRLIAKTVEAL